MVIKDTFWDFAEISLCLFAIVQYVLRKFPLLNRLTKSNGGQIAIIILSTLISVLIAIILCVVITLVALYKESIHIYLKIKHGKNYGGILGGIDNIFVLETNRSRHIVNCLLFFESNKPIDEMVAIVKKICLEKLIGNFSWIRKSFMGYNFRLLNQFDINDLLKELVLTEEERTNKELFENKISSLANVEMPKDNAACCEMFMSNEYVTFASKKELYPLFFRVHHSVGDGVSLLSFLIKQTADQDLDIVEKYVGEKANGELPYIGNKEQQKNLSKNFLQLTENYTNKLMKGFEKINTNIYTFPLAVKSDTNCLRSKKQLSGDKLLSFLVEENSGYIQKIKNIKVMVPGVTFSDVLLTLVSASFYQYFKERGEGIPSTFLISFALLHPSKKLEHVLEGSRNIKLQMGNNFSTGMIKLPIDISRGCKTATLRERLLVIKNETDKLRNSIDILLQYWQVKLLSYLLPPFLLGKIIQLFDVTTMSLSNLPGISSIHINGFKLQDVLFWLPNFRQQGVGLSILTYDRRFQLGLIIDKALVGYQKNTDQILKRIFKYLDELHEELENNN